MRNVLFLVSSYSPSASATFLSLKAQKGKYVSPKYLNFQTDKNLSDTKFEFYQLDDMNKDAKVIYTHSYYMRTYIKSLSELYSLMIKNNASEIEIIISDKEQTKVNKVKSKRKKSFQRFPIEEGEENDIKTIIQKTFERRKKMKFKFKIFVSAKGYHLINEKSFTKFIRLLQKENEELNLFERKGVTFLAKAFNEVFILFILFYLFIYLLNT